MGPRNKLVLSDKIDFKANLSKKNRKDTTYSSKGKIHQEDIAIFNTYVPNRRTSKFIKETLIQLKSYIDSHTSIVADANIPLLPKDRPFR